MAPQDILCFHCGQAVADPPALNELPDGTPCPVCRDRLLEALPAPFPSPVETPILEGSEDDDRGEAATGSSDEEWGDGEREG